jgi:hypothetical protein
VFGVFNGMVKSEEHTFSAVAETNCLLYSWTIDELTYLATQTAPCGAHLPMPLHDLIMRRWCATLHCGVLPLLCCSWRLLPQLHPGAAGNVLDVPAVSGVLLVLPAGCPAASRLCLRLL